MIDVALVDLGGTLADETFMRRSCERFPTWTSDYLAVVEELRADWDTGRLSSRQFAAHVGARLDASPDEVHHHMLELCRSLSFYPAINAALRQRRARGNRQALVIVNPDLFDTIARHYSLRDQFDVIVTSWEQGTDNKVELCRHALELLGGIHPARSVLIDNVADYVNAWEACGGRGYVFQDDATFVRNALDGQVPGFVASDVDLSAAERRRQRNAGS
jgi:FMN phosphatase YigB (HAD superfamily)